MTDSYNLLGTEVKYLNLENLACDPLICTMNQSMLIVSNQMEEFISIQRVKLTGDNYTFVIFHAGYLLPNVNQLIC